MLLLRAKATMLHSKPFIRGRIENSVIRSVKGVLSWCDIGWLGSARAQDNCAVPIPDVQEGIGRRQKILQRGPGTITKRTVWRQYYMRDPDQACRAGSFAWEFFRRGGGKVQQVIENKGGHFLGSSEVMMAARTLPGYRNVIVILTSKAFERAFGWNSNLVWCYH